MGDGSEFTSGSGIAAAQDVQVDLLRLIEKTGQEDDPRIRGLAGRALVHREVKRQLSEYVYRAVVEGRLPPTAGSIIRASMAEAHNVETDTAHEIAASAAVVSDDPELLTVGTRYLGRQIANIGGGTVEMARNVIGERQIGEYRSTRCDEIGETCDR